MEPKEILENYYLDTRWHLLEVAAMLDRLQRAGGSQELRKQLLDEALALLASETAEPNRTERLLNLFSKLDLRHAKEEN